MIQTLTVREAETRVAAAKALLEDAERRVRDAQGDLNEAQAAEMIAKFRTVEWQVLYELRIGGMLVRYDDPSDENNNARNLPRRFRERPGCLVSGEFDRRTPVSDTTMRRLVQSGLAQWRHEPGCAIEMRLTPDGERRTATMTRPS